MGAAIAEGGQADNKLSQFGSFDGKDNRREILILFQRFGDGEFANRKRAIFLQSLIRDSKNGFADKMCRMEPCDATAAYFAFVHITGVLGVNIDKAAAKLEQAVR